MSVIRWSNGSTSLQARISTSRKATNYLAIVTSWSQQERLSAKMQSITGGTWEPMSSSIRSNKRLTESRSITSRIWWPRSSFEFSIPASSVIARLLDLRLWVLMRSCHWRSLLQHKGARDHRAHARVDRPIQRSRLRRASGPASKNGHREDPRSFSCGRGSGKVATPESRGCSAILTPGFFGHEGSLGSASRSFINQKALQKSTATGFF